MRASGPRALTELIRRICTSLDLVSPDEFVSESDDFDCLSLTTSVMEAAWILTFGGFSLRGVVKAGSNSVLAVGVSTFCALAARELAVGTWIRCKAKTATRMHRTPAPSVNPT